MFIKKLKVKNSKDGYEIAQTTLSKLNVLVGVSGAGKTSFIRAISCLQDIAEGEQKSGFSWIFEFIDNEKRKILWSGRYSRLISSQDNEKFYPLVSEKIKIDGYTVAERVKNGITYKNSEMPAISPSQSLVYLLRHQEDIRPMYLSILSLIIIGDISRAHARMDQTPVISVADYNRITSEINEQGGLDQVNIFGDNCRLKIFLNYKHNREKFDDFEFVYCSIFPTVSKIVPEMRITKNISDDGSNKAYILIRINMSNNKIVEQHNISSGMFKTMMILAELMLSHDGSIILIDEIENGLGVNCLPDIIEQINISEKQIVVSTHHPRVIDGMPLQAWKIVSRADKTISITDAIDVIDTKSSHDNFIKLINNKLYMDGNRN